MNRGGLGLRSPNIELQQRPNPSVEPRFTRFGWTYAPGDKVIQTVNNYDKDVFNGDIGRVARIDEDEPLVFVDHGGPRVEYETGDLDELSLADATTVHKSQGSEYPAVVIPLGTPHYLLLERNLLDAAVARGRQLVLRVIRRLPPLAVTRQPPQMFPPPCHYQPPSRGGRHLITLNINGQPISGGFLTRIRAKDIVCEWRGRAVLRSGAVIVPTK
jgi:hypothetical protein